jgi:hypothetical protein
VNYILEHHPYLSSEKLEVNPNSIDLKWLNDSKPSSIEFKKLWGINSNALICIYGGNLGKPQGIHFLIKILQHYKNDIRLFFFIIGNGTEFNKINLWFESSNIKNARLINQLPKKEFDKVAQYCDAGLILLDRRFTIPNFPSRLLTYLENKMAVWAATDLNTDIGKVVAQNDFGFWVTNEDLSNFILEVEKELNDKDLNAERGKRGFTFLKENYSVLNSYNSIIKHM